MWAMNIYAAKIGALEPGAPEHQVAEAKPADSLD